MRSMYGSPSAKCEIEKGFKIVVVLVADADRRTRLKSPYVQIRETSTRYYCSTYDGHHNHPIDIIQCFELRTRIFRSFDQEDDIFKAMLSDLVRRKPDQRCADQPRKVRQPFRMGSQRDPGGTGQLCSIFMRVIRNITFPSDETGTHSINLAL